ncbi:MAG: ATP-dependent Zn protease [Spirulinaceae cyanobacterium SM2_1_0]|nr:ATP-dependent Zn protease [Spirulinaceae cyanobacterium SM2_1_0]
MQQTGLNLLAISIFAVTMMVLVGPVVQLSPALPAGLTFGMLALVTADRFGWQGRGLTLLVDWVAGWSSDHRDRIIHHEAGHFLVAYLLGIPVTSYTLNAWDAMRQRQPGYGGVQFDTRKLAADSLAPTEAQLLLDRFCTVWMAGAAAETEYYGSSEGGGDDRQKVRAALELFGRSAREAKPKQQWAFQQARSLLMQHPQAYQALIAALKAGAPVEDCYQRLAAAEAAASATRA